MAGSHSRDRRGVYVAWSRVVVVAAVVVSLPLASPVSAATYPDRVLAGEGPIGYWRLGEPDGQIAGAVTGPSGTYHGPSLGQPGAVPDDTAAAFDGDDSVVIDGYPGITGANARSLEFFLKTSSGGTSILEWGGKGRGRKYHVRLYKRKVRVVVGRGSGTATTNVADGNWHHVVITMPEGGSLTNTKVYVDGMLDGFSGSGSVDTSSGVDLTLGRAPIEGRFLRGMLDEVALYDRPLTDTEVRDHYAARAGTIEPDPIGSDPYDPPVDDLRVAAVGDIACDPLDPAFDGTTPTACHMWQTSDLVLAGAYHEVLVLGDLQYTDATLDNFTNGYALSWGRPGIFEKTRPVPGNHEYQDEGAAGYKSYFGSAAMPNGQTTWYSFDRGAWHFVALDSNCKFVGGCGSRSPQAKWLAQDLERSTAPCTLAFWHHPRFSSDSSSTPMKGFWDPLYAHGAELVLNGHKHHYERFAPMDPSGAPDDARGIVQITPGTGGINLHDRWRYPRSTSVARNGETFGILDLTLSATGYSFEFLADDTGGAGFEDRGSGTCR